MKKIALILCCLLVFSLWMTGCSKEAGKGDKQQEIEEQDNAQGAEEEEADEVEEEEEASVEEPKLEESGTKSEQGQPDKDPAVEKEEPLEEAAESKFIEEENGVWAYLDTETSPLDEGGIKVELVPGEGGHVKFIVTDLEGNETVEYYQFIPQESMMHRHRYVAAMGNSYHYYYDYISKEMVKITNGKEEDVTESMKSSGRWDSAVQENGDLAEKLLKYFEDTFEATLEEAVVY